MFELEQVEAGFIVHFSYFGEHLMSSGILTNKGQAFHLIKTLKEKVPNASAFETVDFLLKEVM